MVSLPIKVLLIHLKYSFLTTGAIVGGAVNQDASRESEWVHS